jgi:hypothetical protein
MATIVNPPYWTISYSTGYGAISILPLNAQGGYYPTSIQVVHLPALPQGFTWTAIPTPAPQPFVHAHAPVGFQSHGSPLAGLSGQVLQPGAMVPAAHVPPVGHAFAVFIY